MAKWDQWLKDDKPEQKVFDQIAQKKNGLAAINGLLWDTEDEVRVTPDTSMSRLALLCKRISTLNDGRADLVHELSKLYGADEVHEKIYGANMRPVPFLVR